MSIKDIIVSGYQALINLPKKKLVQAVQLLRDWYNELLEKNKDLEERISILCEENKKLKEEIELKKIISINEKANKLSLK